MGEVSIEESLQRRFGIQIGDEMRFDVLGRVVRARVANIRKVNWRDYRSGGFMLVFRPGLFDRAPHGYIASATGPSDAAARARLQASLVAQFPNVSVIDLREVLQTVETVVSAVTPAQTPYVWDLPAGWPAPRVPADNPMSDAKVRLGRELFYDTRLSGNGTQSCASCHTQALAFTDGKARSVGVTGEVHPRSSMSLANVAYNPVLTWGNPLLKLLENQALVPMFNEQPVEMGLEADQLAVHQPQPFPHAVTQREARVEDRNHRLVARKVLTVHIDKDTIVALVRLVGLRACLFVCHTEVLPFSDNAPTPKVSSRAQRGTLDLPPNKGPSLRSG